MTIKVAQVAVGRFHHFDLARELDRLGMLARFYTGYPSWKLRGQSITLNRVDTFPWVVTSRMALARFGLLRSGRLERTLEWIAQQSLDHHVARTLPECDVLFVLSGAGLHCGRVAQQRGVKYVCDRGSSHIAFQDRLLREEYARWGDSFTGIDPRVMVKEQAEYELADLVTVPSEFVRRSFLEFGVPESKLRKVPYGVNLQEFYMTGQPPNDSFNVLFVGNVSLRKGVPYLLEAFRKVKHPRKRLSFAGTVHPIMIQYLRRHGLPDRVDFLGHVPRERLRDIMSRSHVMVLPSIEEGLALVQAQALACGCPVISTTNSGAEDLFDDGVEGFIVPPRDPNAIRERIEWLADDPQLRERMSKAGMLRVKAMGGVAQYGSQIASILSELVAAHGM